MGYVPRLGRLRLVLDDRVAQRDDAFRTRYGLDRSRRRMMASNEQSLPWWSSSAPATSYGIAPSLAPTAAFTGTPPGCRRSARSATDRHCGRPWGVLELPIIV